MSVNRTARAEPLKLPWYPWIGKRPYYGWVIVIVGWLTQFMQGVVSQGFATYLSPLQQEFGWSRAVMAGPRSVTQAENALLGPFQGLLVDRLGPRFNVAIGTVIMGVGLIMFGLTHSLWMFFVSNILIGIGTSFQGLLVLSVCINHWFRSKRTMANAIMLIGFAMAGVVGIPALVFIQMAMGWRTSLTFTGILVMAIGLPLSMLLRRSPEPYGLQPDGAVPAADSSTETGGAQSVKEYDFSLREALRNRTFWLLAMGLAIGNLGQAATGTHLFLHLEQGVGLSRVTGAFIWSIASITNIPARLIGGYLGDRLPKNVLLASASAVMSLSTLVLGLATSFPMAVAYAVIYGIGWGVRTPVMNSLQGEYFGMKSQGVIRGMIASVTTPITIAAPILVGYVADVQGTYRIVFSVMSFVGLAGSALILIATRPKPPVRR